MPVVFNLALASLLQRDPERPSFTWTADGDVDIERITRQYSLPDGTRPTPQVGQPTPVEWCGQ